MNSGIIQASPHAHPHHRAALDAVGITGTPV